MAPETNRMRPYSASGSSRAQQARDAVGESYRQAETIVQDYPASAVLVTFGLGCALGFLATSLLAPQRKPSWYATASKTSESLGQRISEAVMNALPDAVTRRM